MTDEIKLKIILKELNKLQLEEGWKDNIMAAVIAASGLVGGSKAKAQDIKPATTQTVSTNNLKISLGNLFQSGQYLFDVNQKEAIKVKLEDIGNFLKSNPEAVFEVKVVSSESQVPNSGVNMKPGELADKRSSSVEELLKVFIKNLKDKKIFSGDIQFATPDIKIGPTPYHKGDNSKDNKFTKEQFINLDIRVVGQVKSTVKTVDFSNHGGKKDPIYMSGKIVGMVTYPLSKTANIKNAGTLDTSVEDAFFQPVDSNTGKASGEEIKVPFDWWNNNVPRNTITDTTLNKIKNKQFN